MKILVPAAGNKVEHIQCFKEVEKVEKVIITDVFEWTYGSQVADIAYIMPPYSNTDLYLEYFEKLYLREKFDVIILIDDYSLSFFHENRDYLNEKYPFTLAINSKEVVDILIDKIRIYNYFIERSIPTISTLTLVNYKANNCMGYPLFIKPRYINMQRSKNIEFYRRIDNDKDMDYVLTKLEDSLDQYVLQSYISGIEYNIDLFCDGSGILKSYVVLRKDAMGQNRGISRGEIIDSHPFDFYINRLTENLQLYGVNQIQAFISGDNIFFTEINGRFSGSSVFVKHAGVNYFKYFIDLISGTNIIIKEKPRLLKMSTWQQNYYYEQSGYRII